MGINFFKNVGTGLGQVGNDLGAKDFGLSEFVANLGGIGKSSNPYSVASKPTLVSGNPQASSQGGGTSPASGNNPLSQPSQPIVHTLSKSPVSSPAQTSGRAVTRNVSSAPAVANPAINNPLSLPEAQSQPQSLGFFMGKEYFNPEELYGDQLAYLDSVYGSNLSQLRQGKTRQLGRYEQQKGDVRNQLTELLGGYDKRQEEGLGGIAGYYGNLGDIYQSSQGVREDSLRGEVTQAKQKTRDESNRSLNAIEQAIAEYMGEVDLSERELAGRYQGSRDEIGNSVVGDPGNRLNVRDVVGRGVETNLTSAEIGNNNALIDALSRLKSDRLGGGNRITNSGLETNPILEYLSALS